MLILLLLLMEVLGKFQEMGCLAWASALVDGIECQADTELRNCFNIEQSIFYGLVTELFRELMSIKLSRGNFQWNTL